MITLAMLNALKNSGGVGLAEVQKNVIFPDQAIEIVDSGDGIGVAVLDSILDIVPGKEYTVLWDETEYKCVGCSVESEPPGIELGNGAFSGGENNTGEPFLFAYNSDMPSTVVITESPGTHKVAIYEFPETIHPIDPKYLPGVCLPVVELETEPTTEGAALTAKESAIFAAASAAKSPIVAILNGDTSFVFVMNIVKIDNSVVFSGVVDLGSAVFKLAIAATNGSDFTASIFSESTTA